MKVLLSAYACEPDKGSEPGIGWNWALEIARLGHEVWVLTRSNNREVIETRLAQSPAIKNLNFLYYDLPLWARWWKKRSGGVYLYYFLWQWGAYHLAKKIHKVKGFDRVHHITFGSFRQPSFMGNLGIPFIFGPVAGGESAPWRLRMGYGWRGWVMDGVRDMGNFLIRLDPFVRRTFKQAEKIYVTTEQTLSLLPVKYRKKSAVQLAIGLHSGELAPSSEPGAPDPGTRARFRILYVGRVLYWKGMHLGLRALACLLKERPDAQLTIVGSGPGEKRWRTIADQSGVGERIDWIPWLNRRELSALYSVHDVFLYPSLHDSGGMVVLEAMAHGMPVVCLDLGGPRQMVDDTCGFKVKTDDLNEEGVIQALADRMLQLADNLALGRRLSTGATRRVKKFSWSAPVAREYSQN